MTFLSIWGLKNQGSTTWIFPAESIQHTCLPLVCFCFRLIMYSGSNCVYCSFQELQAKQAAQKLADGLSIRMESYNPEGGPLEAYREVHDDGAQLSSEEDWPWGPTGRVLACWYVWPLALDQLSALSPCFRTLERGSKPEDKRMSLHELHWQCFQILPGKIKQQVESSWKLLCWKHEHFCMWKCYYPTVIDYFGKPIPKIYLGRSTPVVLYRIM